MNYLLFIISLIKLIQISRQSFHSSKSLSRSIFSRELTSAGYSTLPLQRAAPPWVELCNTGQKQSPIDFPTRFSQLNSTAVVQILSVSYLPVTSKLLILDNWKFYGNGTRIGSIKVKKNLITYSYILTEFVITSRSEHSFGGKYGDIELQLVHTKDKNWLVSQEILADPDDGNDILIISVIFNTTSTAKTNINFERLNIATNASMNNFNLNIYPPIGKPFFYYIGSITRPNCTENVNWIVVNEITEITQKQLSTLQNWFSNNYKPPINNRVTQKLNNRIIYYQYYPFQINYNTDSLSIGTHLIVRIALLYFIAILCYL